MFPCAAAVLPCRCSLSQLNDLTALSVIRRNAPAKINMGLHVLRKRADGFHDIETVFLRIPWMDVLHAEPADALSMTCSDDALPVDERNLVIKAALLLRRKYDVRAGAALHLDKHIPYGAGLGSGSSDAAAALILLNTIWELDLSSEQLNDAALELGSDVPFFLGAETAWGRGRGERLEPLIDPETNEPYSPSYPLVVVVPPVHVSTAEAYAMIEPRASGRPDLREVVLSNDLSRWTADLKNDFEIPILSKHPALREIKASLIGAGAGYAAMSGSGSAVYGFFEEDGPAMAAAEALKLSGHNVRTFDVRR